MTVAELIRRCKASSAVEVLTTIANDPAEARDFALTIGPALLGPLLREDGRKRGVVATTPGGRAPSPRADWGRLDWRRYADWLKALRGGVSQAWQFAERVCKAFGKDDNVPYGKLRASLGAEDAERLDVLCGKRLGS